MCTLYNTVCRVYIHYLAGVGSKSRAWTAPHVTACAQALLLHLFTFARAASVIRTVHIFFILVHFYCFWMHAWHMTCADDPFTSLLHAPILFLSHRCILSGTFTKYWRPAALRKPCTAHWQKCAEFLWTFGEVVLKESNPAMPYASPAWSIAKSCTAVFIVIDFVVI